MGQHTFSKKRFPFNGLWELQSLPLLFPLRYNAPNVSPFLRTLVIPFSSCSQCNFYSRAISSWKIVSFGFCQPRKRPPSLTINGQICTKDSLLNLIKLSSGIGRSHVLYFGGKILTLARKTYLCWFDFGIVSNYIYHSKYSMWVLSIPVDNFKGFINESFVQI